MGQIYTVLQINKYIRNMFENDYLLRDVQIQGELSNVKYHSSGHIYFKLKDDGSAIDCVMFRNARLHGLDFEMQDGQSVIIKGNVSAYERDGKYQIYAQNILLDGRGYLYEAYEQLKQKLYEEGMFEFEHKKEIPKFSNKIGIVTASTGAAVRDIQNVARRRNPYVQLYLYPAIVQGEKAAQTIVKGIQTLDQMNLDVIIIGRGGGSIEDLWPFNEEIVARAIYEANTPIISGTGHETDTTIADYVADLRAPTPSAACELAVYDLMSVLKQVEQYEARLSQHMASRYARMKQYQEMLEAKLERVSPRARLGAHLLYCDALEERIKNVLQHKMQRNLHRYELLLAKLHGLSPTAKLVGGYGYLERENGEAVRSVSDLAKGDTFQATVSDGTIVGVVSGINEHKDR